MPKHRPQKRFGQHFLTDKLVPGKIVGLINPTATTNIVEIGPGEGVLTLPLAISGARVAAVEFDRNLISPLHRKLDAYPNVQITRQDFLDYLPDDSMSQFVLVGNIPYNITSPIMDWCVKQVDRLSQVVLMVQREMGRRITGHAGSHDWAPISIITQLYFEVSYEFEVPPTAFTPPPKVYSAVITLKPRASRPTVDLPRLERLLKASFTHRRKLLVNNLVPDICPTPAEHAAYLEAIGARPDCRAEQVTIEQFITLTDLLTRDGRL